MIYKQRPHHNQPKCDDCGKRGTAQKREKLDANLRSSYRILCRDCGTRLGFRALSFDRSPVNWATTSMSRP